MWKLGRRWPNENADGAKAKVDRAEKFAKGRRKQQPGGKKTGKNLLEAKAEIDRFVDDALLAGLDLVRIVHGKGVLAGKVRDYLRQKKLKYSVPPEKFGGDGVSEVRL